MFKSDKNYTALFKWLGTSKVFSRHLEPLILVIIEIEITCHRPGKIIKLSVFSSHGPLV